MTAEEYVESYPCHECIVKPMCSPKFLSFTEAWKISVRRECYKLMNWVRDGKHTLIEVRKPFLEFEKKKEVINGTIERTEGDS